MGLIASFHQSSSYFCLSVGNVSLSWCKRIYQIMVITIQVLLHFNFLRLFIPLMWKQVGKNLEYRKNTSYSVVFSHIRGCQPALEFCLKVFPDAVCILVQRIK